MTRPEATERTLAPHALAHDGFRWHVRAYCHTRSAFRDFVIARMLEASNLEDTPANAADDHEWHTMVPLVLAPHPGLSSAHKKVVELDYGMHHGQVEFQCRQAFLFYALRHLRLDLEEAGRPEAQQITLKNRSAIEPFLSNRAAASEP